LNPALICDLLFAMLNPKLIPARLNPGPSMRAPSDSCGFILHEKGRQHYWEGIGLLSIKSFSHGRALYDTGRGLYAVDESSYLILNNQQPYSITIESNSVVESFCIFFKANFAEQVYYSLSSEQGKLLDNPVPHNRLPVGFFDKTYPHDRVVSPALLSLKSSLAERKEQAGWLEERMHELMQLLLHVREGTKKEALALNAVRVSTREELYRRLIRAKDYISACFDRPLTLKEIASVACLSPNHLLRSFRQAFHQTPHQFLNAKRLEHAQNMLAHSELSVTDICFAVGFESLSSFSRMFRHHTGFSPNEYRRKR